MVIDLKEKNESVKPEPSRIRKFLSFLVAFFYAGVLINAIRAYATVVFFLVIGKFPDFLNLLIGEESVKVVGGLVVVYILSRKVYRRFTHTLSEEEKQKMSVWKSGATGLFITIGLLLYYVFLPAITGSVDT
jgi:uncharacterized BrkB/YihY/UPF0761 family membrane protein